MFWASFGQRNFCVRMSDCVCARVVVSLCVWSCVLALCIFEYVCLRASVFLCMFVSQRLGVCIYVCVCVCGRAGRQWSLLLAQRQADSHQSAAKLTRLSVKTDLAPKHTHAVFGLSQYVWTVYVLVFLSLLQRISDLFVVPYSAKLNAFDG